MNLMLENLLSASVTITAGIPVVISSLQRQDTLTVAEPLLIK